jgi:hypothetical protein
MVPAIMLNQQIIYAPPQCFDLSLRCRQLPVMSLQISWGVDLSEHCELLTVHRHLGLPIIQSLFNAAHFSCELCQVIDHPTQLRAADSKGTGQRGHY